jgi:hypothetical protein
MKPTATEWVCSVPLCACSQAHKERSREDMKPTAAALKQAHQQGQQQHKPQQGQGQQAGVAIGAGKGGGQARDKAEAGGLGPARAGARRADGVRP